MGTAKALVSSLLVLLLTVFPYISVRAESIPSPRVLIGEIQTESSTDANQEFVELINVSGDAVDLSGWVVQYRAASGTSWADKALLSGLLYPNGSIVVSTQGYLLDVSSFFWSQAGGVLAATGGNVRLLPANSITPEDIVAWGTGIYGETVAASKAPKGSSINRKSVAGLPQDTNNNSQDFETLTPSPRYINVAPAVVEPPTPVVPEVIPAVDPILPILIPDPLPTPEPVSETTAVTDPEPVAQPPAENSLTPPVSPSAEVPVESPPTSEVPDTPATTPDVVADPVLATPIQPLSPVIINELMINPGAPLNDADDEWVELYNPNETSLTLAGMKVQTGTSFSHSYTFTDETLSPFGYLTIYSVSTPIALSNTSGAVRILATDGAVWGNAISYEDVEEGNSFARSDTRSWSWTTSPTPSEPNIFTVAPELIPPLVVSKATTSKSTTPKTAKTTAPKSSSTAKVTAVKASATTAKKAATAPKTTKASVPKSASLATNPPANPSTSHPVALAGFAILAVGYALYEYRDDFSNKLRRARRYFETRRGGGAGL